MTLTFKKPELANILNALSPYFTKGYPMSLRVIKGGVIEMFATSAVSGGSVFARIPCDKSEKTTHWLHLDGPTLQQVVSLADEGTINIEIGKEELTLTDGTRSTSQMRILAGPAYEEGVKFGVPSATLKGSDLNLLAAITEAASTDEARPNLHGIYIAAGKKKLESAAADGYILSFASVKSGELEAPGALYAVKALERVKRACKAGADDEVRIGFHANGITFSITRDNAEYIFDVPKMDGAFPDYKAIVKAAPKALTIEVETGAFASFLKRASAIDGNVFIQAVNGFLWLMAQNQATKEKCLDSLAIENTAGESAVMYYAHGLLKDTLKACAANGKVSMAFPQTNKSPMLFEGAAGVVAMPLVNPLEESPFKGMQPALI